MQNNTKNTLFIHKLLINIRLFCDKIVVSFRLRVRRFLFVKKELYKLIKRGMKLYGSKSFC
jgi:hypothetical protein